MNRKVQVAAVAALLLAAGPAAAQVASGIPVYHNPRGGTGLSVAANLGFPNGDAGGGSAFAVSGGLGFGNLNVTGTLGSYNSDGPGDAETTYGGTVGLRLIGGGLMPVSVGLQAGASYISLGSNASQVDIPVSLAIAPSLPLFPLKPWVAPRVHFTRMDQGLASTQNATSFGLSAGADFNLLLGLGFHAAVDVLKVSNKINSAEPTAVTFGVGAHFNFRVPMM